jgi:hypothetical protein
MPLPFFTTYAIIPISGLRRAQPQVKYACRNLLIYIIYYYYDNYCPKMRYVGICSARATRDCPLAFCGSIHYEN